MSFYAETTIRAEDWEAWKEGEVALSVADEDFGQLISLDEYDLRLVRQVNGDHGEDVVDAECCVVSDMTEVEEVCDLGDWYGGSYAADYSEAMYYAIHPPMMNDGISILAMDNGDDVLLAIGFGN